MLVTISISFAVRYIVRTGLLDMLRAFSEPVVAITWDQEDLVAELRARGLKYTLCQLTAGIAPMQIPGKRSIYGLNILPEEPVNRYPARLS